MKLKNLLISLISIVCILGIWFLASLVILRDATKLPSPIDTTKALINIFNSHSFLDSILATVLRSLIAFAFSFLVAIIFALISFYHKSFFAVISPIIKICRSIPTLAIVFIIGIFFGGGNTSVKTSGNDLVPIIVCVFVICPIMFSTFFASFNRISSNILELDKVCGLSHIKETFKIILPFSSHELIDSSASTLSLGTKIIIASEVLSSLITNGIGPQMSNAQSGYAFSFLLAWTIIAVVICFVFESLIKLLHFFSRTEYHKFR